MDPIVRIAGLSHRYNTSWAIRNINIEISRKGIYGLLGSNGAGKSTTMNILCGALNQTQGEVYINGIDVRKRPVAAKKQIGFLPQVAPLYLDLTVQEYLFYCARLRSLSPKEVPAAVTAVMERCGLTHVKDRLLKNLSGGYRQRVGIAQSIIHQPRVVILDEPTNGLDPMQIIEVRNLIREIANERTVILSSHILTEIQLLCQEIIMIEQGRLVFSDSIHAFNNYIAPQSMLLELDNPPASEALAAIRGVSRVEGLTEKSFRLFYDGERSVSDAVVNASVQQQWRLVQLVIEKNSIDEIFKQLTRKTTEQ
ncbi:MAG: ABC transporter ATP-binding protein [Candidatus Pseudobacter hemicellulosilyticus]|uniref:ABC transporter ATP-binding protein n=1 Tax=Candidatus Pseudobacter hemicellulosilyticus TaxID=3121375 RepID=A0AAJ5WUR4_9BACT|nr:MAG: ABC transporter ATP-binding protein [Pseudobacter sp.]